MAEYANEPKAVYTIAEFKAAKAVSSIKFYNKITKTTNEPTILGVGENGTDDPVFINCKPSTFEAVSADPSKALILEIEGEWEGEARTSYILVQSTRLATW